MTPTVEDQSPASLSEYYLDLERLLSRVEDSSTHYQALGLDRAATVDEIKSAYAEAVSLLHPSYQSFSVAMPDAVAARVERAFERIAQAFSVLANYGKRVEYDNSIGRRSATPLPLEIPTALQKPEEPEPDLPSIGGSPSGAQVFSEFAKEETKVESFRRCERLNLSIPVRVAGHDQKTGKWAEMAQTLNVNRLGVSVLMSRRLWHGRVVHLTLPLPVKLRNHGHADPSYQVYAIVRRVEPPNNGKRVVGFEFLGDHPPRGYLDKPWRTFRTVKWAGPDRRQEKRKPISEPVELFYLDSDLETVDCQLALTENVSPSGARVYVKDPPVDFDWIRLIGRNNGFQSLAELCNRFTGTDGYERLCLHFLENKWPE